MLNLSKLTEEQLDKRAMSIHEPRWMRQQRLRSWQSFRSAEDINWKKSKTPKLDFPNMLKSSFAEPQLSTAKVEKKAPENSSGKIVLQDGEVLRLSLLPELANKGVIFTDMRSALLERADLVEYYLAESDWGQHDQLSFLQRSLWQNGVFLFIPKGLVVEHPFHIQIIQKDPEESILQRSLFILDEQSSAIVEEQFESATDSEEPILCSTAHEVFANQGAHLRYYSTQNWGKQVYDLSHRLLTAAKDASITSLFTLLGAGQGRMVTKGNSLEPGARIEHQGVVIAGDEQRFKILAEMDHAAEQTEGMMRYKGILTDQAYSSLDGLIRVHAQGRKASSRLEEHTLLLSEKARCDALPALDIRTDDVQVSHSASITQADQEKIFYLMSRGLSQEEATALIIQGFFENLLSSISTPSCYESIKTQIDAKLNPMVS